MSKVFSALAISVDGYITGRDPGPGRGLGDGGTLFDWYFDGDVPSLVFDSFRLSEPSARFFDAVADRVGASIAGRNTYEDSSRFGDDGTPHPAAPLFVLSHRPAPQMAGRQRLITTGLADAVAAARDAADGKESHERSRAAPSMNSCAHRTHSEAAGREGLLGRTSASSSNGPASSPR